MRIAILTREYPHLSAWGGMATFYSHMAHALRGLGHQVEIFAQGFHGQYTEVVDGVTVHRIQSRRRGRYLTGMNGDGVAFHEFCRGLSEQIAQFFRQRHQRIGFDAVEAHDHLGISAALNKLDMPVFVTGHTSLAVFASIPGYQVKVKGSLARVAEWEYRAHLLADRIRFLSHDLRQRTSELFAGIEARSSVVFNPCRIPDAVSEAAFTGNPRGFIVIGRLEPRKGVQLIPEAMRTVWREFPDAHVAFVGNDCFYPEANTMMSDCLRDDRLHLLGWKARAEVDALLEQYPHVLVPSLYDNSAYSAQEGMAFGRCVLTSDAGGTKEYVADTGMVFRSNDAGALAEAMLRALREPRQARQFGQAARARAAALFDRRRFANQFIEEVLA